MGRRVDDHLVVAEPDRRRSALLGAPAPAKAGVTRGDVGESTAAEFTDENIAAVEISEGHHVCQAASAAAEDEGDPLAGRREGVAGHHREFRKMAVRKQPVRALSGKTQERKAAIRTSVRKHPGVRSPLDARLPRVGVRGYRQSHDGAC